MWYRLAGLVVPFGERTDNPPSGFQVCRELIAPGAFGPETLASNALCRFTVNHRDAVDGAAITFLNEHHGLYATILVPRNSDTTTLMQQQAQWKGVSIGFDESDIGESIDWPSCTRVLWRVGFISQVSLVLGEKRPAYPGTWMAEYGPDAIARAKAENEGARVRKWGPDYRSRLPRAWWATPRQSPQLEQALCARDPEREISARFGELPR
jgi:phage head maturation protease